MFQMKKWTKSLKSLKDMVNKKYFMEGTINKIYQNPSIFFFMSV